MPAAKLLSSGTLNAMKSEEGNDSIDTFIRQAIGKEPLLPFPRTADSPVQWIQLLHALDQPGINQLNFVKFLYSHQCLTTVGNKDIYIVM